METSTKRQRDEMILEEANRGLVSYEEIAGFVRVFADNLKAAKDDFKQKLDDKTLEYLRRFNSITDLVDEVSTSLSAGLTTKADARQTRDQMEKLRRDMQALVDEVRAELPEVPDLSPLELELSRIKSSMPPKVDGTAIWQELNNLFEQVALMEKEMGALRNNHAPGIRVFGGARGFQLLVNSLKKGQVNYVNFIPGTGMTITHNTANGRNDITFSASASGSSLGVLAATGTVDDSNTSFTFPSAPTIVVVNGASYRNGHGCTIAGTSVTLDSPVGASGDIYGLG